MQRLPKGLTWDQKTGKGRVDKLIAGKRVRARFSASTEKEAIATFYQFCAAPPEEQSTIGRTFREAATKYLTEATHTSIDRDAGCLANLDPWIGKLELKAVHQGTLQAYIEHRRKQGIKSKTVARELSVVRRILTLAARLWRDENNEPWLATPPLLAMPEWNDVAKPHILSWEEQNRLLRELPKHLAEMALFALNTGARDRVISYLRWDWEVQVPELKTSVFLVPPEFTKNGTEYLMVLNRTARSIVDSQRGIHPERVFTYLGQPTDRIYNSGWKRAWKAAGLPTGKEVLSGPHTLRHTFARRLRAAGVPLELRKVLMHHIDGDVTLHYSPAEIGELIEAVEKLQQAQHITLLRRVV